VALATSGCDTGSEFTNDTEELALRDVHPADTDTAVAPSPAASPGTGPADATPDRSPVSGLPDPPASGVPRPCGKPGNLRVLDWAGFKGAVSYTYDDSQPSHVQHYDELQATGIRQTFYVNRETGIASLATWQQALADGHEIANHTAHHCRAPSAQIPGLNGCIFGTLPADATPDSEIDQNTEWITSAVGAPGVWTMATPFGDANWDPFASSRFLANRDVFQAMVAPNDDTDPFHLPCYMAGATQDGGITDSEAEFEGLIDTARAEGKWMTFLFHTILPTPDNWYGPVDIGSITGSIEHLQQLGDVWADSMVFVAAYWRAQKLFNSLTPTRRGRVTTWTWELPPNFPPGMFLRVTVDGGRLFQGDRPLRWDDHGFYEVALDAGSLTLRP